MPISPSTIVAAAGGAVACELGDEVAILNLESGTYYGLDAVGARIWKLLASPIAVSEIRDSLLQAYEVDAVRCEADVVALVEKLLDEGLVELRAGGDA